MHPVHLQAELNLPCVEGPWAQRLQLVRVLERPCDAHVRWCLDHFYNELSSSGQPGNLLARWAKETGLKRENRQWGQRDDRVDRQASEELQGSHFDQLDPRLDLLSKCDCIVLHFVYAHGGFTNPVCHRLDHHCEYHFDDRSHALFGTIQVRVHRQCFKRFWCPTGD